MKLIIAGSRTISPTIDEIANYLDTKEIPEVTEIVCGMANGVDLSGRSSAKALGIDVKEFPADWNKHNKAAGPIRNKQMAEYADSLLLIWDGKSKGSANMKANMLKLNKPIYEVIINEKTTNE